MNERKDTVTAVAVTICLMCAILASRTYGGLPYDPWWDITDDGKIDIKDLARVSGAFGTYGTAINKTQVLLDLQNRVSALEEADNACEATYIIYREGSIYKARNGATGEVCNNSNARTVIQYAIDNTVEGLIFIKEGDYPIDSAISIQNREKITLQGSGMATCLRTEQDVTILGIATSYNLTIRDIRFSGQTYPSVVLNNPLIKIGQQRVPTLSYNSRMILLENLRVEGGKHCIEIYDTERFTLSHVSLWYATHSGLYIHGTVGGQQVDWNTLYGHLVDVESSDNCYFGILIENARDMIRIDRCHLIGNHDSAIRIYNCTDGGIVRISNCDAESSTYYGLILDNTCWAHVTHSYFGGNMYGIAEFPQCDYNTITYNDVRNNIVFNMLPAYMGTHSLIQYNLGFQTESRGESAITSGDFQVVNHGLDIQPRAIHVTPTNNWYPRDWWVTEISPTSFKVKVSSDVTTQLTFIWEAEYIPDECTP